LAGLVIDVGLGNTGSVLNMFRSLDLPFEVAASPAALRSAPAVVLPGVGHFDAAMRLLEFGGWAEEIRRAAAVGTPLLGICLGMQLLFEGSAEGTEPGLAVLEGRVERLPAEAADGRRVPVPHMGWNFASPSRPSGLMPHDGPWRFYFVHSYAVPAKVPSAIASTTHGVTFTSAVQQDNVFGVQFHPEKSHRYGRALLRSFGRTVAQLRSAR